VLAIRDQIAPPTINYDDPDRIATWTTFRIPRPMPIQYALSNSFGFAHNGCLIFKRYSEE